MGLYDKFARLANDREQFQTSGLNPFGTCIDEVYSATQGRIGDQKIVLAGTNNYLGLTFDAQAIAAGQAALAALGTGTTGSRMANGSYGSHLTAAAPSFSMMLAVLLWLSFIYGLYNGAMIPALTEIMPTEVRVAGFSLAYSLATAVFGGFTPVVSTALIEYTGDKASPGYWMSFAALCALLATLYMYRRIAMPLQTAR